MYLAGAVMALSVVMTTQSCKSDEPVVDDPDSTMIPGPDPALSPIALSDSLGWYWEKDCPWNLAEATYSTSTEAMRLHFYGWELDEDTVFHVSFPASTEQYTRAVLTYRMCGWNQGPAEWDMTTMIKIYDKENDAWIEFVRAITPYGGSFGPDWEKKFYLDITEFLPLMQGETDFRIFYCGWDATDERAHAVQLTFSFFEEAGRTPQRCIGRQKLYDSTLPNDGSNGYRAWSYGVAGWSIEDPSRLGERTIDVPLGTDYIILRVCITGHGQDSYNGTGRFPNRKKTKATSCAEFDHNRYEIVLNGEPTGQSGYIWEINEGGKNYPQAGTYKYNRGGWGPGKPCNVQHWLIKWNPLQSKTITLDFNLEEYVSPCTEPNQQYVACYYVMADAFLYGEIKN